MDNNKSHYEELYKKRIDYKYKTNTRYQRFLVEQLEKELDTKSIKSVCDVGCGQGLDTVFFVQDFDNAEVLGIDLSSSGIAYANELYGDIKNLKFECANILDFDLSSQKYDLVTAFELLEHIEDWKSVANAMTSAANRYIMVSAPVGRMRDYEVKHGHYRNFRKGELERFFENNGFKTLKVFYAGFPFWSPITRDLLNLMPDSAIEIQGKMNLFGKISSQILFFLYRYCSLRHFGGDQFVGVFERKEKF